MKKIVMMMLVLASMSVKVNAQWFVSGNAGIGYLADRFQMKLLPAAGYEFNDRWAVGFGLGMGVQRDYVFGIVAPYVRFNCWNNGKLFVDVKANGPFYNGKIETEDGVINPSGTAAQWNGDSQIADPVQMDPSNQIAEPVNP